MHLLYYSYEEDKVSEYNSQVISKISAKKDSFDFNSKFEFSVAKEFSSFHVVKIDKNYQLTLIEYHEKSTESSTIRIGDLKIVNKFIDDYIRELDYKVTKNSIEKYNAVKKKEDKEKYEKWKIKYDEKRKKEKYDFLKPVALTSVIVFIIGVTFYYWNSEEYKFIFRETEIVTAEITKTDMVHAGRGYYYQKLIFEYKINNEKYKGEKTIGKRVGIKKIGDLVKLKISKKNPKINKVIGYYKN